MGGGVLSCAATAQHGPAPTWFVEFGTPEDDWATGVAPDGAGGVFVAGDTGGDLGGPSAGADDAFIARYTAQGDRLWVTQLGTVTAEWDAIVAADGGGGAFASGRTWGSFLGMPRVDDTDIWLARFDAAGGMLWLTEFGTKWDDASRALEPDGAGGVFLAGGAESPLAPAGTAVGAFVSRHDSGGRQVWATQFGVTAGDLANAICDDGSGGVFVAGQTDGDLVGSSAGRADAFLAKMAGNGELLWVRQFGTEQMDEAHGVASDGAGGAFVAGHTSGDSGRAVAALRGSVPRAIRRRRGSTLDHPVRYDRLGSPSCSRKRWRWWGALDGSDRRRPWRRALGLDRRVPRALQAGQEHRVDHAVRHARRARRRDRDRTG
ncbi:MAG: SBBP repeat-containing protein [Phycisphaerales bacterium JB039]